MSCCVLVPSVTMATITRRQLPVIAAKIVEDLQAAVDKFALIAEDLRKSG